MMLFTDGPSGTSVRPRRGAIADVGSREVGGLGELPECGRPVRMSGPPACGRGVRTPATLPPRGREPPPGADLHRCASAMAPLTHENCLDLGSHPRRGVAWLAP